MPHSVVHYCTENAEAALPVRLVRLWPDHFSSRPDCNITCSVVNLRLILYADSAMASVSRPSCGPTIETPQQPRSFLSQNGHFDATSSESASSSLKIHAKNFPALCADRSALHTSALRVGRTTFCMPLPPLKWRTLKPSVPCRSHDVGPVFVWFSMHMPFLFTMNPDDVKVGIPSNLACIRLYSSYYKLMFLP